MPSPAHSASGQETQGPETPRSHPRTQALGPPPRPGRRSCCILCPPKACVPVLSPQPKSSTTDLDSGLQGNLREKPAISQEACTSPGLDVNLSLQHSTLTPRLHTKLLQPGKDSAPFLSLGEGVRCEGEPSSLLPSAFASGGYTGPPLGLSYLICQMGPITPTPWGYPQGN